MTVQTPKQAPKLGAKNGVTARQKLLKTFTVDYTSVVDDVRYTGKFTTKKLSIADLATLGVRKAQLNGGMHHDTQNPGMGVDAQTDDFNSMIAHLDLAIQEAPTWWKLDDISDADLVSLVFQEVVAHENSFLRSRGPRSGSEDAVDVGTGQAVGKDDQEEAGTSRVVGALVEQEVQSALEP